MLTAEIRTAASPIRLFIDEVCDLKPIARRLNVKLKSLPLVMRPDYPDAYTFSLAGTAADLRIRALFNPAIHGDSGVGWALSHLEAVVGLRNTTADGRGSLQANPWHGNSFRPKKHRRPSPVVALRAAFEEFLTGIGGQTVKLDRAQEEQFVRFCVLFARFDHYRRGGVRSVLWGLADLDIPTMLDRAAEPSMVADVIVLGRAFRERHPETIASHSTARAGCTLAGSADVGGADLDMIVDGTLWEIKTTLAPKITTENLRQVVGYWLLDYDDELGIRDVAIELTRQGHTERLDIACDLLSPGHVWRGAAAIRAACRERLSQSAHD